MCELWIFFGDLFLESRDWVLKGDGKKERYKWIPLLDTRYVVDSDVFGPYKGVYRVIAQVDQVKYPAKLPSNNFHDRLSADKVERIFQVDLK